MVEPLERSAVGKPTCAGSTEKRVGYCSASRRSYPIAATDAAVSAFCMSSRRLCKVDSHFYEPDCYHNIWYAIAYMYLSLTHVKCRLKYFSSNQGN